MKKYIIKDKNNLIHHEWDDSNIKNAFNFQNWNIKHLKRYCKDNNLKILINN